VRDFRNSDFRNGCFCTAKIKAIPVNQTIDADFCSKSAEAVWLARDSQRQETFRDAYCVKEYRLVLIHQNEAGFSVHIDGLSQIIYIFATNLETMASIEERIWTAIQVKGRGNIFFPSDFTTYGDAKAVSKSLERLTHKGNIIRLARGIYTYPEMDTVLGLGALLPSIEQIAETIARRDKARIVPTGIYAMNKLGLSTQVPMNVVYLTDGAPRKINLGNGRSIQFKYTTPKNLSFTNPLAMLVTFALKEVGRENMTEDIARQVKSVLQKEKRDNILSDESLMPEWIRTFTRQAYE
jgi:hypothetical protein